MLRSTLSSARLLPKSLEMLRSSTAGGADACSPTPRSLRLMDPSEAPGVPLPVDDNPLLLRPLLEMSRSGQRPGAVIAARAAARPREPVRQGWLIIAPFSVDAAVSALPDSGGRLSRSRKPLTQFVPFPPVVRTSTALSGVTIRFGPMALS